jgi:predicted alpha/beta-fold hydrolase
MITAPLNGYSDSDEYYQDNATAGRLGDMPIPAIIVAAADDPVVTIEPLAELARKGTHPSHLQLELTSGGGHLGYVGRGKSMLNWAEQRVVEWLISRF